MATSSDHPREEGKFTSTQNLPHPIKELEVPPEIYEAIFSFIEPWSVKTLLACSLVSRSWVSPARRRLFQYKVALFNAYREAPQSRLSLSPEYTTPSSTILPYVQKIQMVPPLRHTPETYESLNEIVTATSGMLTSLQRLRIFDIRWSLLTTEAKVALFSHKNVTIVFLSRVALRDVAELGDILTQMVSLREIELVSLVFEEAISSLPPSFSPAPLSLVSLRLEGSRANIYLRPWLSSLLESRIRLQSLKVESYHASPTDINLFNKLIRLYSDTLHKVTLPRWIVSTGDESEVYNIDFNSNVALKHLFISTGAAKSHSSDGLSFIINMIETFPPGHHLQHLILCLGTPPKLSASDLYYAWKLEWSRLDQSLAALCARGPNVMRWVQIQLPYAIRHNIILEREDEEDEDESEEGVTDNGDMLRDLGFPQVQQQKDVHFTIKV